MMSGSNVPDFNTYELFRAKHSHNSPPIFAYRGIIIPLLCSYRGGSQCLSPTYEQAHVGLDLLTLVSYILRRIHDSCTNPAYIINQPLILSNHMPVYSKTFILPILESELIFKVCLKIFYLNSFLLHSISISYCYSIIFF